LHVALRAAIFLVPAAFLVPASAGDAQDGWKGKQRIDIVALLGEPNKTKKSADGSEVLVYTLIRVGDEAVPSPTFRVFELPGVGRVGRVVKNEDPAISEIAGFEPSGISDKDGHLEPGGLSRTRSVSTSWDPKTGERTGPEPPEKGPRTRGKIKLEFTLDAHEIVRDWSVSPK